MELVARTRHVAKVLRTAAAGVARLEDLEEEGAGGGLWRPIADPNEDPAPWWELTGTTS
ncbi:hypothetical protein [Kitasatospora griseola]|uniref:hypothetical protein n=1 Tax=Kitasatospora griseola TaxID=2064 RepID=UPI00382CBC87